MYESPIEITCIWHLAKSSIHKSCQQNTGFIVHIYFERVSYFYSIWKIVPVYTYNAGTIKYPSGVQGNGSTGTNFVYPVSTAFQQSRQDVTELSSQ